jgi:two-component system phosphate regulon sensor histidine kinase PhoR
MTFSVIGAFQRRLIGTYLLLVLAVLAIAGLYLRWSLKHAAVQRVTTSLQAQARLMGSEITPLIEAGDARALHAAAKRLARQTASRITIIGPDGTVLADSDQPFQQLARMDNHLTRPEIRSALAGGAGSALRTSDTAGSETLYVALALRRDGGDVGVLRLGIPIGEADGASVWGWRPLLIGGLTAVGAALVLGIAWSRRVIRPIAEMTAVARRMADGDFSQAVLATPSDEIGQLGRALNALATRLQDRLAELEEQRAKEVAILDSMVEGVVAIDGERRILFINASACRVFGVSSAGASGRPFLEVIRNKEILDMLDRALSGGTASTRECNIYTPVERIVQVRAASLTGRDRTLGAIVVLHDVTELRRLERVRTEFVANISHELRTPLTSIRGYLETLLGGALEDRAHAGRFLEVIHKHTERLGRLLDDLLDLSNLELGKITLRRKSVDLGDVVIGAVAIYGSMAVKQGIEVKTLIPHDLPPVLADRDRLTQIFVNLLDNALKFTPQGGTVSVAARRVSRADLRAERPTRETARREPDSAGESDVVEVSVQDTGIGIPSQDLPRITERFYRVDRARSSEMGGTGLGLAIVKYLVKAHGSDLIIESELNKGTSVRFNLPVASPNETHV